MDSKVKLIKSFYRGLPKDRAKLETQRHGFAFLEEMLSEGVTLEYGELTQAGVLHKYKLANIPEHGMDALLMSHVEKTCNLCLYFDARANDVFCFNLDNNHKTNNTVLIAEMEFAIRALRDLLREAGCEPLVIASGRGYHAWCRLDTRVDNERLYELMVHAAARALEKLHENGYDQNKIKFNFYPDVRSYDVVSLRLFGSDHAKNKVFSRILTVDGLLDEQRSWHWFEKHLANNTITEKTFTEAHDAFA